MRTLLLTLLLLCAVPSMCFGQDSTSTDPKMLSLQRGAAGLDARALWIGEGNTLHFDPAVWASYSLATNLSASVVQGWNTDVGVDPLRVGLRMYVPWDEMRVALGANYLYDWEADSLNHAWSVGLYAGWMLKPRIAAIASAERIFPPQDAETVDEFRLGLRYAVLGGK